MTKLTTERLEKLQDDLLQFQDSYSDPADKENYDIFVDALHVIDEFKIAKEKILAYEQAAKNPAEYKVVSRFGDISLRNQKCEAEMYRSMKGFSVTPLYAAPVLPKQPELLSIGELLHRLEEQTGEKWVEESAQPVIPEQQTVQLDPHVYRELVNELRDVALEYHSAQQLRERISRALSKAVTAAHPHLEQPVSNPYKFLDERAKYRVIIEGFSNSRSVDFEACSQEEAEEIGRDIFHEECNYGVERLESIPAQESE